MPLVVLFRREGVVIFGEFTERHCGVIAEQLPAIRYAGEDVVQTGDKEDPHDSAEQHPTYARGADGLIADGTGIGYRHLHRRWGNRGELLHRQGEDTQKPEEQQDDGNDDGQSRSMKNLGKHTCVVPPAYLWGNSPGPARSLLRMILQVREDLVWWAELVVQLIPVPDLTHSLDDDFVLDSQTFLHHKQVIQFMLNADFPLMDHALVVHHEHVVFFQNFQGGSLGND